MGASGSTAHPAAQLLPATMKAAVYDFKTEGGVRMEYECPTSAIFKSCPKKDKFLLVKVLGAGVNAGDQRVLDIPLMKSVCQGQVAGFDICGEVLYAPENSGFKPGDIAWGDAGFLEGASGSLAEFAAFNLDKACKVPEGQDPLNYAAINVALQTCILGFKRAGYEAQDSAKGQTCVIIGASGGIGSFAVQYASRWLGFSRVVGVCSGKNGGIVESLGATEVVDYTKGKLSAQRPDLVGSADYVIDLISANKDNDYTSEARKLLKPKGVGGPSGQGGFLTQVTQPKVWKMLLPFIPRILGGTPWKRYDVFVQMADKALMNHASDVVSKGKVQAHTTKRAFDADGIKEAFDTLRSGRAVGKYLFVMKGAPGPSQPQQG